MKSTVYYLEMCSEEELQASEIPEGLELKSICDAVVSERFYREVGEAWEWTDRLVWSAEEWQEWVDRDEIKTWLVYFEEKEAGYVEMEQKECGSTEIVYFGLLKEMIGKKLGGAMLTLGVRKAWELEGTKRVWLHTCTEDHEHALANYEKRGFREFKKETVFTSQSSSST